MKLVKLKFSSSIKDIFLINVQIPKCFLVK